MNQRQASLLKDFSKKEEVKWHFLASIHSPWCDEIRPPWLLELAATLDCESDCSESGVIPVAKSTAMIRLFSLEGFRQIRTVARSEYYFWVIVTRFAEKIIETGSQDKNNTVARAIESIREDNVHRLGCDRILLKPKRNLNNSQVCRLTSMGAMLWSGLRQKGIVNPLYLTLEEYLDHDNTD